MIFKYNNKEYEIIIDKKNNKNTYIRVKDDLKIYVSTSYLTTKLMIKSLIKQNESSIIKMIEKVERKLLKENDNYFLGNKINIIITDKDIKRTFFDGQTLYVKKEEDIEKWYKKKAVIIFKEHLDYIYNNFSKSVPYPSLTIRKMKTRWGVCNKKLKKITLNYNLIYMDTKYLDYVIVHELSHFIHFNHSKNFWNLVSENEPDYKKIRKEMRE